MTWQARGGPARPTMRSLVEQEVHLILFCHRCRRQLTVTPWEAVEMFGEACTIVEASRRMKCSWCGERQKVEARPCTLDLDARSVLEAAKRERQMWPTDELAQAKLREAEARWEARRPRRVEEATPKPA